MPEKDKEKLGQKPKNIEEVLGNFINEIPSCKAGLELYGYYNIGRIKRDFKILTPFPFKPSIFSGIK